jgi:hypothetical protein
MKNKIISTATLTLMVILSISAQYSRHDDNDRNKDRDDYRDEYRDDYRDRSRDDYRDEYRGNNRDHNGDHFRCGTKTRSICFDHLTRWQRREVREDMRMIDWTIRRAESDGRISRREARHINRLERDLDRKIDMFGRDCGRSCKR